MSFWNWRRSLVSLVTLSALASYVGGSNASAAGTTTWRGGFQSAPVSLEAVWMDTFADAIEKSTQGRIKVLRFPAGQLGPPDVQLREVQQGSLDLTLVNTDLAGALSPKFTVFSTPYLFPSLGAADAVVDGPVGAQYLKEFDEYGLVGLAVRSHSLRSFLSNKLIKNAADMKGVKIRTQGSESINRLYESLGAIPVTIAPSEIITGLKTGTVVAADTVCWLSWGSKLYEGAKYDIELNAIAASFVVVLNQKDFQALSTGDQKAVRAAAHQADLATLAKRNQAISEALNGMRSAGLTVFLPDQIDSASFKTAILANGMPKTTDPGWQKLYNDSRKFIETHKLK
jgi:TRAP-type C4-dicarboxylate transport system substrate-binding protein